MKEMRVNDILKPKQNVRVKYNMKPKWVLRAKEYIEPHEMNASQLTVEAQN